MKFRSALIPIIAIAAMAGLCVSCTAIPQPPHGYAFRSSFGATKPLGQPATDANHPESCITNENAVVPNDFICRIVIGDPEFGDTSTVNNPYVISKTNGAGWGSSNSTYGMGVIRTSDGETFEGCWDGGAAGAVSSDSGNYYCEYRTEYVTDYKPHSAAWYFADKLWHWSSYTIWEVGGCFAGYYAYLTGGGAASFLGTTCVAKPLK